jgi:hypothetical protein
MGCGQLYAPTALPLGGGEPRVPNRGRVAPRAWVDAMKNRKCYSWRESTDATKKIMIKTARWIGWCEVLTSQTGHNGYHGNDVLCPTKGPKNCLFHIHERSGKTIQFSNCFVLSPARLASQTRRHVMQVTSITKNMRHTLQRDASIYSALTCR